MAPDSRGSNDAPGFNGAFGERRAEEEDTMTGPQRNRIRTRFTPADTTLVDRQWAA